MDTVAAQEPRAVQQMREALQAGTERQSEITVVLFDCRDAEQIAELETEWAALEDEQRRIRQYLKTLGYEVPA